VTQPGRLQADYSRCVSVDGRDENHQKESPGADGGLQKGIPTARGIAAAQRAVEAPCPQGQAGEERGDHGQDRYDLVPQTHGKHPGPRDFISQTGEAREEQDEVESTIRARCHGSDHSRPEALNGGRDPEEDHKRPSRPRPYGHWRDRRYREGGSVRGHDCCRG